MVTSTWPRAHPAPYLPGRPSADTPEGMSTRNGCTSIHFGENQLSPGSIGISPLSTGHPPVLQHWWVRASTRSYPRFTLPMDSSPGFGPHPGNQLASSLGGRDALCRLAFAAAPRRYRRLTSQALPRPAAAMHSSDHSTKGTPSAHGPCGPVGLRLLVGAGVQALFHPPRGVLFTFPSRYSFPIGGQG